VATLQALKELGVRLALDDFGTGYSALGYLSRFAVDTLKVDRSFITDADRDPRTLSIVRAITAMAHALGMDVTAEGIETARQLAAVRAVGCDWGQGYYFSRPVSAAEVTALLQRGFLPAS
jgi:EAL domain-containing protein (putative c-di-GMP-specific phosphodiesterase class I)